MNIYGDAATPQTTRFVSYCMPGEQANNGLRQACMKHLSPPEIYTLACDDACKGLEGPKQLSLDILQLVWNNFSLSCLLPTS